MSALGSLLGSLAKIVLETAADALAKRLNRGPDASPGAWSRPHFAIESDHGRVCFYCHLSLPTSIRCAGPR